MRFKNEKGSITIFVLVALLFMSAFLMISYANNVNKSKIAKEQFEIINSIYQMSPESVTDIYDRKAAVPIINSIPDVIFVGFDNITSYIESGNEEELKQIEYIIDEKVFNSEEEMNNYIKENNAYGEKDFTITVTNSLEHTTTKTQKINFKPIIEPVIGKISELIITNITIIQNYYTTYDELGKKEETYTIEAVNETFNTMTEVVEYADKWLLDNKQYEVETSIKVVAKGNNNLTSESIQTIKFIRGVKVANEKELNTALSSTAPSYIQIANNIPCNSTINVDGVTHRLDLNNYEVSRKVESSSHTFITLGSNTNLTVFDSSEEKQGTILVSLNSEVLSDGKNRQTSITCIQNNGTLNLESGIISSNNVEKMLSKKEGTDIDNNCIAVRNAGNINLNGGTLKCNLVTQACSYLSVRESQAYAYGIFNTGIVNLNSGAIITNADAYMIRANGATVWGKTYAYAFGIESTGTVNRNGEILFITTAVAHEEGTYARDQDSVDIKED